MAKGRTVRIKVFKFDELNDAAKEKAIDRYRQVNSEAGNPWDLENIDSLKAFMKLFPVENARRADGIVFSGEDTIKELTGVRLATYLWNNYKRSLWKPKYMSNKSVGAVGYRSRHSNCQIDNVCVLTGYWMDNEILHPVYDFINKPDERIDFEDLMQNCYAAFERAREEDIDFQNSDEQVIEAIKAKEYEFKADGTRF